MRPAMPTAVDSAPVTPDDLRTVEVFADLPDPDLQWLINQSEIRDVAAGTKAFSRGEDAMEMIVILSGELEVYTFDSGARQLWAVHGPGTVTGLLPFSRMERYGGEGFTPQATRMLVVHESNFKEMLTRMPVLGKRLTAIMSDRVRESARIEQQQEKMMALGKLSAGLAHELNNPAAAVRRTSETLGEMLAKIPAFVVKMAGCDLTPTLLDRADAVRADVLSRPRPTLSVMERTEREDNLVDWLETHAGHDPDIDPWTMAESLCDAGFTVPDLEAIGTETSADALPTVLGWVHGSIASQQLLADIQSASERISELVGAVKGYTHMDRGADPEPTDLHNGINQTLVILGSKSKDRNAQIVRDFDADLPTITAHPGALNQVWTNLLDNALDAIDDGGTITIRTEPGGLGVCVLITDDGAGIPDDVQSRIFEPFFTTKDVGDGTGLGLDIVHRIVQGQHQGQVSVESEPGRTTFTVQLPIVGKTERA